jgi:hypothetical protein
MNRWLYAVILPPALSLSLLVASVLRSHGLHALQNPVALGATVFAGTAVIAALWAAYSRFLSGFASLDLRSALLLDAACHAPLLLCLTYFVPSARSIPNPGTTLLFGSVMGTALSRLGVLIYARRSRVQTLLAHPYLSLAAIVALAALLRVSLIALNRFHGDEALYSYWGLLISSGKDIFLRQGVIVDKPPVFFYVLALFFRLFGPTEIAARLPSIMASLASIVVVYHIVADLADRRPALLSALFLTLSPFDMQFAPTAFTDPLMVALALASWLLALKAHYLGAGLLAGLAFMTKPTAIFFLPMLPFFTALGLAKQWRTRKLAMAIARVALGFLGVCLAVVCWDVLIRVDTVNFLSASASRYGGLRIAPAELLLPRLLGWLRQLRYLTGSQPLNILIVPGVVSLLIYGWWRDESKRGWMLDWALASFGVYYVAAHTILSFSIWDRYMLGLAPVVAILLARISFLPYDAMRGRLAEAKWPMVAFLTVLALLLCAFLLPPTQVALRYGFPVGGDHGAFQGIDDVADYFRANARPGSIVFHKWLGWHYSFYMFGVDVEYYYYPSHEFVLNTARRLPELDKYVVFPSWTKQEELSDVLRAGGWELAELYRTYRPDGTTSFTIYQVQAVDR